MNSGHRRHGLPCKTVLRYIGVELDGGLRRRSARTIRVHLRGCVNCRRSLDSLKKVVVLYRRVPARRPDPVTRRKLWNVLREQCVRDSGGIGRSMRDKGHS